MTPEQKKDVLSYVEVTGKALAKAAEVAQTQEKVATALKEQAPALAKTLVELGLIDAINEKTAANQLTDPVRCQAILGNTLKVFRQEKKAHEKVAATTLGTASPDPVKTAEATSSPFVGVRTTEPKPYDILWRKRVLGSAS